MATGRFADYFNHKDTADVKVVIEVVQSDENLARRQLQLQGTVCETTNADLCAHAIILICNSPVWKAQLERWQDTGEPKKITMIVEDGEEVAAFRLVQCLYTACLPDIETEVDLRMNLGILMLADQYQIEAALSLCAQKLEMLKDLGAISWELADRVMQLPAGYLEKPGLSCLLMKIQEKILLHVAAEPSLPKIGLDLEVVMRNSTLKKGPMELPLVGCATLLSDDRCRVASENTVAAAVVERVDRERSLFEDDSDEEEAAELRAQIMADVIRVPHLSSLFAAAMPTYASQLTTVVRTDIYALGRELDRLPADLRGRLAEDLPIPRCWLAGRRPPSTLTALEFDWDASAAELAEKFDAGRKVLARSPRHFFAGMNWTVRLTANPVSDDDGRTVGLYIYAHHCPHMAGPQCGAMVNVSILGPDKKSSLHEQRLHNAPAGTGRGWKDFFKISPMQKWDQSRLQKWTSSHGFLTVRVKVHNVM